MIHKPSPPRSRQHIIVLRALFHQKRPETFRCINRRTCGVTPGVRRHGAASRQRDMKPESARLGAGDRYRICANTQTQGQTQLMGQFYRPGPVMLCFMSNAQETYFSSTSLLVLQLSIPKACNQG